MFTDPLLVTFGASSAQFSFGVQVGSSNPLKRVSALVAIGSLTAVPEMSVGRQETRENPDLGGSYRTALSFGLKGSDTSTGFLKANPRVILTIVQPKTLVSTAEMTALLQAVVSFLTGETDGSVAVDAALDTTVVAKLLNGEG